ncbi:hypothetical protein [Pseudoxanthomonas winnipegensis]|uniref:hypothetical protein n=1 Tax=Pseudoxanthomonas winnipegensis TaxID=2480810 RepID=UPI0013EE64FC|nr:hypothetical protein [Pseudoxanthomonas winnipegensis]
MSDWKDTQYPPTKSFKEMKAERLTKGAKNPLPMLVLIGSLAVVLVACVVGFIALALR